MATNKATMTGEEYLKEGYYGGQQKYPLNPSQIPLKSGETPRAGTPGYDVFGNPVQDNSIRYPTTEADPYKDLLAKRATTAPKSYEEIQKEERDRIQAQIDAINTQWNTAVLPELQQEAQGRMGQNIALQSAGGLSTSPRGTAQTEKTTAYSSRLQAAERAKVDNQIASLYGNADLRAQDRADKEATLARQDENAYFDYLKNQQTESKNELVDLFKGGIALEDLQTDPEKYKQLLDNAGIDDFTATALYNSNAPQQAKKDIKYQTIGNKIVAYYYDETTGELKTTESKPIEDLTQGKYKTQITPDGSVLLIPENIDPTKSLDEQIKMYGKEGQFLKPTTPKGTPTPTSPDDTTQPNSTELNKLLTNYPAEFKAYIKSISGQVGYTLDSSSIGQLYQQYKEMGSPYNQNNNVSITNNDKQTLTGAGFMPNDIDQIVKDINQYGLNDTLKGLPTNQQSALKKVFGVKSGATTEMSDEEFIKILSGK